MLDPTTDRYVAECPLRETFPGVAYVKDRIYGTWVSGPMDTPDARALARRWTRLVTTDHERGR